MTINELKQQKRIVILGYDREGKATERFLKMFVPNVPYIIADKASDANYLDVIQPGDLCVRTPGLKKQDLIERGAKWTTGTNIFLANLSHRERTIAVTGSKGKSTTASLIAAMLKSAGRPVRLVGNIGNAMLEAFCDGIKDDELIVMELSSYQLDDIQFAPHIAVFTSLFPEHLDYHGGFDAYFEAKSHITTLQSEDDVFVFHPGYPQLVELAKKSKAKSMPFEQLPFTIESTKLLGAHNLDNIRAAWTVAHQFDVKPEDAKRAVETFEPLPHRLTNIGTFHGITFVDDAIATAPEPTIQALQTLKNVDTIFLGGTDRGLDFAKLVDELIAHNVRNVVLFPDTGTRIKQSIEQHTDYKPTILETRDMKEAVQFAFDQTEQGKTCLLSTASPSYSLWKNYEEKGAEFTKWVKELGR